MKLMNTISISTFKSGSRSLAFTAIAVIMTSIALVQAQSPLDTIRTPEKAVPTVNQTLEGTWLVQSRRPGQPATQPSILGLTTFQPNGSVNATTADGTNSASHGVWVRVGDRKFLQTSFGFNFNESRVLISIVKIRINSQLSLDGQTIQGTSEVVVFDPSLKVIATIPGGTFSSVRLSPEIPADFYDFQKLP